MRMSLVGLMILAGLIAAIPASAGWNADGTIYTGDDGPNHPIGDGRDQTFWMYGGNDWAEGKAGVDEIRLGRGNDTGEEGGGYGTIWACGESDSCDNHPGEDWMYPQDGGGQVNAGQYPARKQHIICANDFEVVFYDPNDVFEGTKSKCDDLRLVGPASASAATG